MTKLVCVGLALALSLTACVIDDDLGTPPQPTEDEGDDMGSDDDQLPVDLSDVLPAPSCATFDTKGDGPCAP